MTNRTKQKIEETLNWLCDSLGLDQESPDRENQSKIRLVYNALRWTAEDVEKQCSQSD